MKLLIISGFLGSGKTTIVQKVIRGLVGDGETVAIIENEIGKVGIDQELLAETGIRITPLFGGCVCCQISGDLLLATKNIRDEIDPDWIVIELTGMAALSRIFDVFNRYGDDPHLPIHALAVVDASRWEVLFKVATPLMTQQLSGARTVIVNKIDVREPTPAMLEQIAELAPGADILPLAVKNLTDQSFWQQIREVLS